MTSAEPRSKPVRLGLIGYGYWGPNLLRNFTATDGAQPVVVADPDESRLALVRRQNPSVETTTESSAVLDRADLDAVVIATPPASHHALARRALENGKHVLVEKPLATSVADAEDLVSVAAQRSLRLMVDHTFLFHPAVRRLRELILGGQLGEVLYYDSVRINLGLIQRDLDVIWDLGAHDFSIMDYLVGKPPTSLTAVGSAFGHEQAAMAFVTAKFSDSTLAHFHLNWMSPTKVRRIMIGGTQRMVVWDMSLPEEQVKVYDKGVDFVTRGDLHQAMVQYRAGDMLVPHVPTTEPLSLMCAEFVDAVRAGRAPMSDGRMGLRVVKLLAGADFSLRRDGSPVLLV